MLSFHRRRQPDGTSRLQMTVVDLVIVSLIALYNMTTGRNVFKNYDFG